MEQEKKKVDTSAWQKHTSLAALAGLWEGNECVHNKHLAVQHRRPHAQCCGTRRGAVRRAGGQKIISARHKHHPPTHTTPTTTTRASDTCASRKTKELYLLPRMPQMPQHDAVSAAERWPRKMPSSAAHPACRTIPSLAWRPARNQGAQRAREQRRVVTVMGTVRTIKGGKQR